MYKIIKTRVEYAKAYAEVLTQVAKERRYLASTKAFSGDETQNFIKTIVEYNLSQFFALEEERIIGWCDIIPKTYEGMSHVGVLGMGVLKAYRHVGIGTDLLEHALKHAAIINNVEKVELEVFKSNRNAIKFYKKHGFKKEGKKIKARYIDGKYDDIILMAKFIDKKFYK